jgi:translation elongation factor EF-1alpha
MTETEVGVVKHYFDKPCVAAIEITSGELKVGDTIHIKGHTTDCTTVVASMQVEHASVQVAKVGDGIGVKVPSKVREHDKVSKVTE